MFCFTERTMRVEKSSKFRKQIEKRDHLETEQFLKRIKSFITQYTQETNKYCKLNEHNEINSSLLVKPKSSQSQTL